MIGLWSLVISAGALIISALTAWLTLFRSGNLKMTWPTLLYLGPDGTAANDNERGKAKVFLRALLYSTNSRGKLIENMFVILSKDECEQQFNVWIYREDGRLSRGSGLHVDQTGIALDHHFLIPPDSADYKFTEGEYGLKIYAKVVGIERPQLLQEVAVKLPGSIAREAADSGGGAFFDWAPDLGEYYVHSRPPPDYAEDQLPVPMLPVFWPRPERPA